MFFKENATALVDPDFSGKTKTVIIKQFLEARGSQTIESLREGFKSLNLQLPFADIGDAAYHEWLTKIDGIGHRTNQGKTEYFLQSMLSTPSLEIQRDEIIQPTLQSTPVINSKKSTSDWKNQRNQNHQPRVAVIPTRLQEEEDDIPHLYDFTLLGDQNFLNYALFDLGFSVRYERGVRQSGFCVSGMTIREAAKKIKNLKLGVLQKVIVNIGSVDIAEDRQLIDMIRDFDDLLESLDEKNIVTVLTTLAPLPNYLSGNKKLIIECFNKYISKHCSHEYPIIDLHKALLKDQKAETIDFELYQLDPRHISGSKKAFLLWNKIGRRRMDRMLRQNLGFTIVMKNNFIGRFI